MKNYTHLFTVAASILSFSCYAQSGDRLPVNEKFGNATFASGGISNHDRTVEFYHVEERINMSFGGSITTYKVSSLSMVNTNDLGPNNTRVITPKYAKSKNAVVNIEQPITPIAHIETLTHTTLKPIKVDVVTQEEKKEFIRIDILSTYERVLDKGYKSVEMLKWVGDVRYFDGNLVLAAKWYAQLFDITMDLEAVYFYRYSKSLMSIAQTEKANAMMKLFEDKICTND